MTAISITTAQARAIATWGAISGGEGPISIATEAGSGLKHGEKGDMFVRRGPASAQIAADGVFRGTLVELSTEDQDQDDRRTASGSERFEFVREGAKVRVQLMPQTALELAANDAEEEAHALGWQLLEVMRRTKRPLVYEATVAIPPPVDQTDDPLAPVCLKIPELDKSRDLLVVTQEDIEALE